MKSGDALGDRRVRREPPALRFVGLALVVSMLGLLLVGWGLGEVARSSTQTVDLDAVRDLAADRTGFLIAAAHVLSAIGSGYILFPAAAVACVALWHRGRLGAALAVAVSTAGAVLIATVDKILVGRPRPPVHHLEHVTSASFPSGHSLQASAFYITLLIVFLCSRPGRPQAVLATTFTAVLVLAIAFSRVALGVHYPTDVVGGLLLGVSWSVITTSVLIIRGR